MEEYDEDMKNNAHGAPNATDATNATNKATKEQEKEALHQSMEIARQLEVELERNHLPSSGVLKATSGNGVKRPIGKQEARGTARASKSAEAAIKQIASQELQAEKARMQVWKQMVMSEVGQVMKTAQMEAMEAQRQSFQGELERVREKLAQVEMESRTLENKIKSLENPGQPSAQNTPQAKKNPVTNKDKPKDGKEREKEQPRKQGENPEVINPTASQPNSNPPTQAKQNSSDTLRRSYAQVVKETPTRSPSEKPWTEVKHAKRIPKLGVQKQEPGGRRLLFPREAGYPKNSEEYIMLALNEALQKVGESALIRFSRVKYSQSGAISALLTEKANAEALLKSRKNILIRAAKMINAAVVGAETLEHWQRLKVHGMPLDRYLGEERMEIFRREVESSTGVQLKTMPR